MRTIDDSSILTPDERFSEVAALLAGGVLRLHARAALSDNNLGQEKSPNSGPAGLEVSEETVLSVHMTVPGSRIFIRRMVLAAIKKAERGAIR